MGLGNIMQIKIKSGGLADPSGGIPDPINEGWVGKSLRNIIRTPFAIGELLAGGPGAISELALQGAKKIKPYVDIPSPVTNWLPDLPEHTPLPLPSDIHKNITKPIESKFFSKGYLEPQGKGEELLDMITGDLPFIFGGGSGAFPKLAQLGESIGGNVALKGAQELGLGIPAQVAAGMTGRLTGGSLSRGILPTKLRKNAEIAARQQYSIAENVAKSKKLKSNATEYLKEIEDVEQRLSKELTTSETKKIKHHINELGNVVTKNEALVDDVWAKKKAINNLIYKTNLSDLEKSYYYPLRDTANKFLKMASEEHPEFGKPFQFSEDITRGLKYRSTMRDLLETHGGSKIFTEKPWLKALLLGGGAYFGHLGKVIKTGVIAYPATLAMKEMARGVDFYRKSSEARKIINNIAKEATIGNKKTVFNLLSKLSNEADSYERQTGQQQLKIKIKSGGLK